MDAEKLMKKIEREVPKIDLEKKDLEEELNKPTKTKKEEVVKIDKSIDAEKLMKKIEKAVPKLRLDKDMEKELNKPVKQARERIQRFDEDKEKEKKRLHKLLN